MRAPASLAFRSTALALAVAAGGCSAGMVMIDGHPAERARFDYAGVPFNLHHTDAHPRPGGASSGTVGYGGQIEGNVCGVELALDVSHDDDHVELNGFMDSIRPVQLVVQEEGGARYVSGHLGDEAGYSSVEMRIRPDSLEGRVGFREFRLKRDGDRYVGRLVLADRWETEAVVAGVRALEAMPAADQAAILPALLTCYLQRIEYHHQHGYEVAIGVPATQEAPESSSLYLRH